MYFYVNVEVGAGGRKKNSGVRGYRKNKNTLLQIKNADFKRKPQPKQTKI